MNFKVGRSNKNKDTLIYNGYEGGFNLDFNLGDFGM